MSAVVEKTCEWCGKVFQADKRQRFCGCSCSAKWRMSQPEIKARLYTEKHRNASRESMKRIWENPETRAKIMERLHSDRNPIKDPKNREKAVMTNRKNGFPQLHGGNGRGPTIPQKMLAEKLNWPMEYPVSTRESGIRGCPSVYKVDVANPTLKIAIEIDGPSHNTKRVKEADQFKTAVLNALGWRVLRFKNEEVLSHLEQVLSTVNSIVQERQVMLDDLA